MRSCLPRLKTALVHPQAQSALAELKKTKNGLVAYLHLIGKDKDAIAKELKAAFKLNETQAVKIIRRITGRVRLYRRVMDLAAAKG